MTRRQLAVAAVLTIFTALPASAQDRPEFGTDRESAAKAAAAGERARALEAEVASLKAEVAELTAGRDAALKLVEITEKILAAQARLAQLADQERDAYKAKAERLEKEKGKGTFLLRVQAWSASGALLGTGIAPGLGTAAGAVVGAGAAAIAELFQ